MKKIGFLALLIIVLAFLDAKSTDAQGGAVFKPAGIVMEMTRPIPNGAGAIQTFQIFSDGKGGCYAVNSITASTRFVTTVATSQGNAPQTSCQ